MCLLKFNFGIIAAAQGNNEEAIKIWENLVEKYPNEKVAELSRNALNQIGK